MNDVVNGSMMTSSCTLDFTPPSTSALDPTIEEISWAAWEVQAADPKVVDDTLHRFLGGAWARLAEVGWEPGRMVAFTELEVPAEDVSVLVARFAVGLAGPRGATASELAGLAGLFTRTIGKPGRPYSIASVDPRRLLDRERLDHAEHGALLRQPIVELEGTPAIPAVRLVSRFNPVINPWAGLAERLYDFGSPVRVRATALATVPSPSDMLTLRRELGAASEVAADTDAPPEVRFNAERAKATLLDLQASLRSPCFVAELSVVSPVALPDSFLRLISGCFTSAVDLVRAPGRTAVASQTHLLGGCAIERNIDGLTQAHSVGLPLRGGLEPRGIQDLMTIVELPLGWPIPVGDGVPGISTRTSSTSVPAPLRAADDGRGAEIGTSVTGEAVWLPDSLRERHVVVTGSWGSGKSTVASHLMRSDLRAGRPFLLVDPHGPLADHIADWAHHLGVAPTVLDADDPCSDRVAPFDRIAPDGSNVEVVERQISRFLDAVAASLPNPEFASVRWYSVAQSWAMVQAAHGASFEDAMVWLNDGRLLRERIQHPLVPDLARSTLIPLTGPDASREAGDVRGWVSAKFHALVSGPVRRMLAAPGEAPTIGELVAGRSVVICNLGGLSTGEAFLFGHLATTATVDSVMSRGRGGRDLYPCYIDEAHRFPADALRRGLSEGRKFGLALLLITQSYTLLDREVCDLALSAGIQVLFRATPESAARASAFLDIDRGSLLGLPDLEAVVAVEALPPIAVSVAPYLNSPTERPTIDLPAEDESVLAGEDAAGEDEGSDDAPDRPADLLRVLAERLARAEPDRLGVRPTSEPD